VITQCVNAYLGCSQRESDKIEEALTKLVPWRNTLVKGFWRGKPLLCGGATPYIVAPIDNRILSTNYLTHGLVHDLMDALRMARNSNYGFPASLGLDLKPNEEYTPTSWKYLQKHASYMYEVLRMHQTNIVYKPDLAKNEEVSFSPLGNVFTYKNPTADVYTYVKHLLKGIPLEQLANIENVYDRELLAVMGGETKDEMSVKSFLQPTLCHFIPGLKEDNAYKKYVCM
jgi:hypothetical protein